MSAGTFTYTPSPPALASPSVPVAVFTYNSAAESGNRYALLPNVRCEQISYKEGASPPEARFSYILDEVCNVTLGWPDEFDAIWPIVGTTPSAYIVTMSQELAVCCQLPDGSVRVLFHGFARVPQADVSPTSQAVTFTAVGVATRCWDTPLGRRPQRDASDPFGGGEEMGEVTLVDAPWRFNPAGNGPGSVGGIVPNCTPDGYDVGDPDEDDNPINDGDPNHTYPVFLADTNTIAATLASYQGTGDDQPAQGDQDEGAADATPGAPVLWDLSRFARLIIATQNFQVANPNFADMEELLQNRRPLPGSDTYDPDDPSTYQTDDNTIRDHDCTNHAWPDALSNLLEHYGFAMRWATGTDSDSNPTDKLVLYRKDAGTTTAPKLVYLPDSNTDMTGATVNLSGFHGGFDFHGVANQIRLDTHPQRYEASFILAPAFTPTAGDGLAANRTQFLLSNLDTATTTIRDKYRVWYVDDLGEGFWAFDRPTPSWLTLQPFDYSLILSPSKDGDGTYTCRRRKPVGTLLSKDLLGAPYKAQLAISRNYGYFANQASFASLAPCIYNKPAFLPTVTWQTINPGSWNLLPDRIGIRIIAPNIQEWLISLKAKVGVGPLGNPWPVSSGKLDGITPLSDPTAFTPWDRSGVPPTYSTEPYWLRLTCVFEADRDMHIVARRRNASPIADVIERRCDVKDHFGHDEVSIYSAFNDPAGLVNPPAPIITRDDTVQADAYARQMQAAHEMPALSASITIPSLVNYIHVGNRVSIISGRDCSFQVNAATEQQEAASYPYVVGLTWDFSGNKQATVLQLADRRLEPLPPRGHTNTHHG